MLKAAAEKANALKAGEEMLIAAKKAAAPEAFEPRPRCRPDNPEGFESLVTPLGCFSRIFVIK